MGSNMMDKEVCRMSDQPIYLNLFIYLFSWSHTCLFNSFIPQVNRQIISIFLLSVALFRFLHLFCFTVRPSVHPSICLVNSPSVRPSVSLSVFLIQSGYLPFVIPCILFNKSPFNPLFKNSFKKGICLVFE